MSIRVFCSFLVAIIVLSACTNTPKPTTKVKVVAAPVEPIEITKDSQFYLNKARQDFLQNNDSEQRDSLLIQAAEHLYLEQKYAQSINLLKVLSPKLTNEKLRSRAYLALAEAYYANSKSHKGLSEDLLLKVKPQYVSKTRLALLQSSLMLDSQDWLSAANALLNTDLPEPEKSHKIWKAMSHLSLSELEKARWEHNHLQPWIQLAIIVQQYALTPNVLAQHVTNWQSQNLGHALQQDLPTDILRALEVQPIAAKRIAVLLPLTGRLSSQGKVLKDGFLAAYLADSNNNNPQPNTDSEMANTETAPKVEISFFDSALKTPAELNNLVADFDVVVGPLLKEKIQELSEILPADKILLALNRIDIPNPQPDSLATNLASEPLTKEHYFFSLAPEDEAQQLADYIHNHQLNRPIIFAANNSVTERMAEAFVQQWQTYADTTKPDVTIFQDNKDMRKQVAEMLDVEQSKERIKQIEYLSNVEVIGQERNRRDIDAIVIFANPEETELLNPIIEASLSSFAEISLSVFASSRSYSQNQTDSSLRDLRNLTFLDMPVLLPQHQWPQLTEQVSQLWPQRTDSLLRLFAMGYDAYSFIPQLRQLAALPQLSSKGLTGDISMQSGVMKRTLPLAKVGRDRVQQLEMD